MAGPPVQRLSYGALAAGLGGIVLIISLFLDWFGSGPINFTGWQAFSLMDIVLFAIGIGAVLLAAMELPVMTLRAPFSRQRAVTTLGVIATTIVWSTIFENDHFKFGIFLAGIAALAILAGGILLERSPAEGVTFGGRAAEMAQGGGGFGGAPAAGVGPGVGAGTGVGASAQPGGYSTTHSGGFAQPAGQTPAAGPLGGGGGTAPAPGAEPSTQVQPAATQQTAPAQASPAIQSLPLGDQNPPPPDRPGQPADWYPDPTGQKRLRYWDGARWTEHVAD